MKTIHDRFHELEERIAFLEEEVQRLQSDKDTNSLSTAKNVTEESLISGMFADSDRMANDMSAITAHVPSAFDAVPKQVPTVENTPQAPVNPAISASQASLNSALPNASTPHSVPLPPNASAPRSPRPPFVPQGGGTPVHASTPFVPQNASAAHNVPVPPHIVGGSTVAAKHIPFQGKTVLTGGRPANPNGVLNTIREQKDGESLVGKYILGALASLLVFIGAASFLAIVWNRISPVGRVSIIGVSGFVLTGIGLKMSLKKVGPIPSILLGTGSGLMYIAILSASLVFHLFDHTYSGILCALWTILLILSYRYTKLFFTVVIAFIGSYVNLCFELNYTDSIPDTWLILLYVTATCSVMLLTLRQSKTLQYCLTIVFSLFSYLTLFLNLAFIYNAYTYYMILGLIVLAIFLLKNLLYYTAQAKAIQPFYLVLSLISSLVLAIFVAGSLREAFELDLLQILLILFAIHLVQLLAVPRLYPRLVRPLNIYYGLVLYLCMIGLHYDRLDIMTGASAMILFFLVHKKVSNVEVEPILVTVILAVDIILLYSSESSLRLLFVIANTVLLFALPIICKNWLNRFFVKNFSMVYLLFACRIIAYSNGFWTRWYLYSKEFATSAMAIWHILSVIALATLYLTNYFKIRVSTEDVPQNKPKLLLVNYFGLIAATIAFFLIGADKMNIRYSPLEWTNQSLALSTLAVSLLLSVIFWKHGRDSKDLLLTEGFLLLVRYLFYSGNGVWNLVFAISHFALLLLMIYMPRKEGTLSHTFIPKNATLIILILSYFSFSNQFVEWFPALQNIKDLAPAMAMALAAATLYTVYQTKYFGAKDDVLWIDEKAGLRVRYDMGIYLYALALYLYGIIILNLTSGNIAKVILTISLLATALLQTHIAFSHRKEITALEAAWTVIQYLALTWSCIHAIMSLPPESVIYSVSGLLLAVVAIYVGFKINISIIRHFGLGISLLMVAKFILVDLSGENSITRVLAFVVGGVLCFLISVIYNRLSKS